MTITTMSKIVSVDVHMDTVCKHLVKITAPEIIMERMRVIKGFINNDYAQTDRDRCLEMRNEAMKLKNYLSIVDAPHEVRKAMDGVHMFLMSITPEERERTPVNRFARAEPI
jgi:hypothetical protein